jgi:hypothetical protein
MIAPVLILLDAHVAGGRALRFVLGAHEVHERPFVARRQNLVAAGPYGSSRTGTKS